MSDSDSYMEEERVFDFGEEEEETQADEKENKQFKEYGGEDFSSYLHDDDSEEGFNSDIHLDPSCPVHNTHPHEDNLYDSIVESKANLTYDDMAPSGRYHSRRSGKQVGKLGGRLRKQLEKATLRFSRQTPSEASSAGGIQAFTFADSKMGLAAVQGEQADSGIGLETGDEAIPGLKRQSWWNLGTLSNKPSPTQTLKGSNLPSDKHSPTATLNSTVSSLFKKVTGTIKGSRRTQKINSSLELSRN